MEHLQFLLKHGACRAGMCSAGALFPFLSERMKHRLATLPFEPVSVIVGSFPFYIDGKDGNIAHFARVPDYHEVVYTRIAAAAADMAEAFPQKRFHPLKNGWPLPIVAAARLSGVALTGRNGLAIDPEYGSYISLSAVVCDTVLEQAENASRHNGSLERCENCGGACLSACPTGAAVWDGQKRVLDRTRCISHITQSKNAEEWQLELLRMSPYVWGCDLCQLVCPYNQEVPPTRLPEFRTRVIREITPGDLPANLDDRHYAGRLALVERSLRYAAYRFGD